VAFALRDGGWPARYGIRFERLSLAPRGDVEEDVLALTRAYTRVLEVAVQAAPEQYFWQHRRWKGAPAEEPVSDAQVTNRRSYP
jgi:lauroyl/myristoyl acyltransferase